MKTVKQIQNQINQTNKKISTLQSKLKQTNTNTIQLIKLINTLTPPKTEEPTNTIDITYFTKQGLNPKQSIFTATYLTNGYNATQAYLKAHPGVTYNTARTEGHNNLTNPNIQETIKKYLNECLGMDKLTMEHSIIQTYKAQAFYNPQHFINLDGTNKYKNWNKIPKELQCCIEGIEIKSVGKEKITVLKLADRSKALLQLSKYIELIKENDPSLELKMTDETAQLMANAFYGKK